MGKGSAAAGQDETGAEQAFKLREWHNVLRGQHPDKAGEKPSQKLPDSIRFDSSFTYSLQAN
jgi:hypothetical protein